MTLAYLLSHDLFAEDEVAVVDETLHGRHQRVLLPEPRLRGHMHVPLRQLVTVAAELLDPPRQVYSVGGDVIGAHRQERFDRCGFEVGAELPCLVDGLGIGRGYRPLLSPVPGEVDDPGVRPDGLAVRRSR